MWIVVQLECVDSRLGWGELGSKRGYIRRDDFLDFGDLTVDYFKAKGVPPPLAWRGVGELICCGVEGEDLICNCCPEDGGAGDGIDESVAIGNEDCSWGVPEHTVAEGRDIAIVGNLSRTGLHAANED